MSNNLIIFFIGILIFFMIWGIYIFNIYLIKNKYIKYICNSFVVFICFGMIFTIFLIKNHEEKIKRVYISNYNIKENTNYLIEKNNFCEHERDNNCHLLDSYIKIANINITTSDYLRYIIRNNIIRE